MRYEHFWERIRSLAFTRSPDLGRRHRPTFRLSEMRRLGVDRDVLQTAPAILLLTSELGCGHERAARAIEAALRRCAPSAAIRIVDWWSLMNVGVADAVRETYLRLVQEHPDLYESIYHLDEHTWRAIVSSNEPLPTPVVRLFDWVTTVQATSPRGAGGLYASDRKLFSLFCTPQAEGKVWVARGVRARLALMKWCWARLARRMESVLQDFRPDAIVSTQMIPAALVSSIKLRRGLGTPSVAVPTDFGVHDFWNQPATDLYCLCHESLIDMPVNLDRTRVRATGVPLMPEFAHPVDVAEARRSLGLDAQIPVILVLGGGLGLGVDAVTELLLRSQTKAQLLVLSGRNPVVRARLGALSLQFPSRLHVHGWTERMDLFVRAADLVVGKPGGLTLAEILACGRPLLATRSLNGQEGFNVRFLERQRVGRLVSDQDLLGQVECLLNHPFALALLQDRAWTLGQRTGATHIAELVLGLISGRGVHDEGDCRETRGSDKSCPKSGVLTVAERGDPFRDGRMAHE